MTGSSFHGDGERWLPVVGAEGSYEVSSLGRVRSLDRTITVAGDDRRGSWLKPLKGRVLRPGRSSSGHLSVVLGRATGSVHVHVMVLRAFVGEVPSGMECRHLDGDPSNNHLANLAWGTRGDNMRDVKHHTGRSNYKLKPLDAAWIRAARGAVSFKDLADEFGVSKDTIYSIWRGRTHTDV